MKTDKGRNLTAQDQNGVLKLIIMRKVQGLILIAIFTMAMFNPQTAEAKKREFAYVWSNGCVGIHTYHSTFFGLFQWETFEVIDCPDGVTPPQV